MEDEGLGIIGDLIMFFFAISLAIFVIVFVLPFILYGLGVYHAGRHLRFQVTQRYKLTPKSWAVLAGVGVAVLTFSFLLASALDLHPILLSGLLIFVPLSLGAAILTLWVWGFLKRRRLLAQLRQLRERESHYQGQLAANEREIERLEGEIQRLERRHGERLQRRAQLQEQVSKLCQREPRVLILRRRRLQEELGGLQLGELRRRRRALQSQSQSQRRPRSRSLSSPNPGLDLERELELSLLQLEELERELKRPCQALDRYRRELERLQQENQELTRALQQLRQAQAHQKAAYQATVGQRLALD